MHPLFMERLVSERQCDLFAEARAANGPSHVGGSADGRIRRALSSRRRARGRSTISGC